MRLELELELWEEIRFGWTLHGGMEWAERHVLCTVMHVMCTYFCPATLCIRRGAWDWRDRWLDAYLSHGPSWLENLEI